MIQKVKKSDTIRTDQRIGVFIDVQNMFYSAKNMFNKKVRLNIAKAPYLENLNKNLLEIV